MTGGSHGGGGDTRGKDLRSHGCSVRCEVDVDLPFLLLTLSR